MRHLRDIKRGVTDGPTDRRTDEASYRVASPRLKSDKRGVHNDMYLKLNALKQAERHRQRFEEVLVCIYIVCMLICKTVTHRRIGSELTHISFSCLSM